MHPTLGLVMPAKQQSRHELCQPLSELRLARRLAQGQLATGVGVSQRAILRLETVVEYPNVPLLVALCDVLRPSASRREAPLASHQGSRLSP